MNRHSSKRSNTKGYQKSPTSSSNNYKKKVAVGGAGSYGGSPALSSNSYKKNNVTLGGFGSSRGYVSSKSISSAGGSGVRVFSEGISQMDIQGECHDKLEWDVP
ncbi:hypothetical protein Tco_1146166 [Tanacetum coccineum]